MRAGLSVVAIGLFFCGCGPSLDEGTSLDGVAESEDSLRALAPSEILGDIAWGTSMTTRYSATPRYRAYRFVSSADQTADVWVRSTDGDAEAWVVSGTFATLAHNNDASANNTDAHLSYAMKAGSTYYLALREAHGHVATLKVSLNDTSGPSKNIDWCGNGIDEDGDGADRACLSTTPRLPVEVKEVTLNTSSVNAGVWLTGDVTAVNSNTSVIRFARNTESKIRISNNSYFMARVSPFPEYAGAWWIGLNRAGRSIDSAVFDAVPGSSYKIEAGSFTLYVNAEFAGPQTPAAPTQTARLEGTMLFHSKAVPVRVTVTPEVGSLCGSTRQNAVRSIDACAGFADCSVWSRITVEQLPARQTDPLVTLATYLPPQCPKGQSTGVEWSSSLIWSQRSLNVIGHGTPGHSETHRITLSSESNNPAVITGTADGSPNDPFNGGAQFTLQFVPVP